MSDSKIDDGECNRDEVLFRVYQFCISYVNCYFQEDHKNEMRYIGITN